MSGVTDCLRVTLQKDGKPVNDGNIRLRRIGAERVAKQWRHKPEPRKAGYELLLRPPSALPTRKNPCLMVLCAHVELRRRTN